MCIINAGHSAYFEVFCIFIESAKSFDLALEQKKLKQNKKFWLSAKLKVFGLSISALTIH